jgi:hypothetical protein
MFAKPERVQEFVRLAGFSRGCPLPRKPVQGVHWIEARKELENGSLANFGSCEKVQCRMYDPDQPIGATQLFTPDSDRDCTPPPTPSDSRR